MSGRGLASFCLLLAGCATTKVETTGEAARPLCRPQLSAVVQWTPAWRPDQKDVAQREAAAQRGIARFFAESGCFGKVSLHRAGALAFERPAFDRTFFITVRELGPVLRIGAPSLLEGGTEAVIEVRAFDVRTGQQLADLRIHWRSGGAFVVKGTGSLEQDMAAALAAAFGGTTWPAAIEDTYWKLTRLGERPVAAAERQRQAHFILHPDGRRMSGSGGCNGMGGNYRLEGERLEFSRIIRTMMACEKGMDTENEFLAALNRVRKARVASRQLQLLDADDKLLMHLEAVHLR
jgi:heat shock protein HslJ